MSDLSISGPGSPVSLKKFVDQAKDLRKFTLLIDGTGSGIAKDHPEFLYVTPEECSKQSIYYSKERFDGRIPVYLYRYLHYLFIQNGTSWTYKTDDDVLQAFLRKEITNTSPDYVYLKNLIENCEHNPEAQQCIGFVQIVGGALNIARKNKSGLRLFIDRPETALHPARQSAIMPVILQLEEDYGGMDLKVVQDEAE